MDDGLRFASPILLLWEDVMKSVTMLAALMAMVLLFSGHAVRAEAAEPLKVGQPAPDFSLPDQNGKTRTLADFRGKWLALYFYVKDDTPGCTEQACKFRDDIHELDGPGCASRRRERGRYRQSCRFCQEV